MQNIEQLVKGVKMDNWTAALLTGAACGVGALVLLVKNINNHRVTKEKIERARNRRDESLQRAEQAVLRYKQSHPTTDSAFIMALSLSEQTKQLKQGSLSPEDMLYSYMEKTLAVSKKVNCCTEILLESLDQLKTVGSNKEGLLYGVPVSIKENIAFKNHDCSCGVIINLDQPAEKDSVLVEVLKKQGAIPFVKTNLPQALLSFDCSNPIYGQTVNPHNPQKTSGGSSGGEGALIGGGGSLLGIGNDLGGSIRVPASFCGICGFKPTAGRLREFVQFVEGKNLTYRSSKPLRIGYLENDGCMQPSPSMVRGIREVKALLEQAGHTLVPYHPLKIAQIYPELLVKSLLADGGTTLLQNLKGEPLDPFLKQQVSILSLPKWLKKILSFLLKPVSPRNSAIISAVCGVRSVPDLWKQHAAVEDYIHETIAHWRSCNIDVLLCPVIGPAYNTSYYGKIKSITSYTMLYNLLNYPAGVVTVSTVTAEDEVELKHQKDCSQHKWDKLFKVAVSGGEGLPVAVQCVALPWQDELCLRFMKEVEQLVKQNKK